MKKIKLIVLILLILASCSKDNFEVINDLSTLFTTDGEIGSYDNSTLITKDNNLIICGNQNTKGIVVLKIAKSGELVWKTEFMKGYECNASSIYENENEEIFVCGSLKMSNTTLGLSDVYIVKMSKKGDTLWSRTYGTSEIERGYQVINSGDDCLLISGTFEKHGASTDCLYLIKIDYDGDTIWTKTYEETSIGVTPYHLLKTNSGDFLLTGTYWVEDGRVLYSSMFDVEGNKLWDKQLGPVWRWGYCTIELPNNKFLTCGRQNSFGTTQLMLVKTDNSGNILMEKEYGSEDLSEEGYSMILNSDNSITISGSSYSSTKPDNNILLLKVDQDGNQIWLKKIGDPGINEWGSNLIMDVDDDFFLTGTISNIREDEETHETIIYMRKIYMTRFNKDGDYNGI
jgi:hypothetical protein